MNIILENDNFSLEVNLVSVEHIELIKKTITHDKKAKINWLLAVTQISEEQLGIIVEQLGFVIKGEYVALPSEAEHIREPEPYKPLRLIRPRIEVPTSTRRRKTSLKKVIDYRFCTNCGIALKDSGDAHYLTGFCSNCGYDLQSIFKTRKGENPYDKERCTKCGQINPDNVSYCFYCGSDSLTNIL